MDKYVVYFLIGYKIYKEDFFEKNDVREECFNELISITTAKLYYSIKKSRRF